MLPSVRGKKSTTLPFVIVSWLVLIYRFALAGQASLLSAGIVPPMSGSEFAAAFAAILGIWQVREYHDKRLGAGGDSVTAQ